MLILPKKVIKYTGAEITFEKIVIGNLVTAIPNTMKNRAKNAESEVDSLYSWGTDLSYKQATITSYELDNSPKEYDLVCRIATRKYPCWLVKNGNELTKMDDDSFTDAVVLGLQNRKFQCQFVWIYDGGTIKLVRVGSELYKKAEKENLARASKPIKSLDFGGIYENLNGNSVLFLGNQSYYTEQWQNGGYVKVVSNDDIYLTCNADAIDLDSAKFGYYQTRFKPRIKVGQLNITIQDVKDHIKKNNFRFLELL